MAMYYISRDRKKKFGPYDKDNVTQLIVTKQVVETDYIGDSETKRWCTIGEWKLQEFSADIPVGKRWRYCYPGTLIFALLLMAMPWIDVKCNGNSICTQSGVQIATGNVSLSKQMKKSTDAVDDAKSKHDDSMWSFVMVCYAIVLISGIATGFLFRRNMFASSFGVSVFSLLALGLLVSQMTFGFPIERAFEKMEKEQEKEMKSKVKQPGEFDPSVLQSLVQFKVSYTFWLWLSLVVVIAPVGCCGAEVVVVYRKEWQQHGTEGIRDVNKMIKILFA